MLRPKLHTKSRAENNAIKIELEELGEEFEDLLYQLYTENKDRFKRIDSRVNELGQNYGSKRVNGLISYLQKVTSLSSIFPSCKS